MTLELNGALHLSGEPRLGVPHLRSVLTAPNAVVEMVTVRRVEGQRSTGALRPLGSHEQPTSPWLARTLGSGLDTAEGGSPSDAGSCPAVFLS